MIERFDMKVPIHFISPIACGIAWHPMGWHNPLYIDLFQRTLKSSQTCACSTTIEPIDIAKKNEGILLTDLSII